MSRASQFFQGTPGILPTAIQCGTLPTPTSSGASTVALAGHCTQVLSGACTAGVLKTALSVTGKGALTICAVGSNDTTSRTHRLRITRDGTVIYDSTCGATLQSGRSTFAHGSCTPGSTDAAVVEGVPILYNSSLLVEYASSLTETDKATISFRNYLR